MKRQMLAISFCLALLSCLMLIAPIRGAKAQDTSGVAGDNVPPPTTQVIQDARSGCTPSSSTGNCTFTLKWPSAFASSTYTVTCYALGGAWVIVYGRTTTSLSLALVETLGGLNGSNPTEVDCIGVYP
jgi:hypothetical protein